MIVRAPVAGLVLALAACGGPSPAQDVDGMAVAACRDVLGQVTGQDRLATTVRQEEPGFLVEVWEGERTEGEPDHLCRAERDEDAERGVRVVSVETQDGSGGYRSRLDIGFDPR